MSLSVLRRTLLPITLPGSWLYASVVALRNRLYEKSYFDVKPLPAPVVSIGNLTVGGSGKTPLVAEVARRCLARGWRVAVLSRGYGRREALPFRVVSDGRSLLSGPSEAGDEPVELAGLVEGLVVAVGSDRFRTGLEVIRQFGPHVFILDDGFQHRRLYRDLDLVCMDSAEALPNLRLLPAGRLREPLSSLRRADVFVWTRWQAGLPSERLASRVLRSLPNEIAVLRARNEITGYRKVFAGGGVVPVEAFRGKAIGAMAAIARPERFREELERQGAEIRVRLFRRDHHLWKQAELDRVAEQSRARGASAVVTTGKDAVKLRALREPALPIYRLDGKATIIEQDVMESLLDRLPVPK